MSDKDKTTFEKWWMDGFKGMSDKEIIKYKDVGKQNALNGWQAACEHKQKEYSNIIDAMTQTSQKNAKLVAENKRLRDVLNTLCQNLKWDSGNSKTIREALKEVGE